MFCFFLKKTIRYRPFLSDDDMAAAPRSSGSSSDTSSPKYDFSDDSSAAEQDDLGRNHRRAPTGRPRRVPTSNSKNAVAARMNRMKQKQYVRDLERKMTALKREMRDVKRELREREKMWESSRRQVAYLRGMIGNSREIGHLLRNIRWRNIVSQGSNDSHKTLNELNTETSVDRFSLTAGCPSLFDGSFDLLEHDNSRPVEPPTPIAPQNEHWPPYDGVDLSTATEVGVCLHVSNRRISVEFCDECSSRFYDNPYAPRI